MFCGNKFSPSNALSVTLPESITLNEIFRIFNKSGSNDNNKAIDLIAFIKTNNKCCSFITTIRDDYLYYI